MAYFHCVVSCENLLLQYVVLMNCFARELCGENGGEAIRDLPLTQGVLGHNLAKHLHLGWK